MNYNIAQILKPFAYITGFSSQNPLHESLELARLRPISGPVSNLLHYRAIDNAESISERVLLRGVADKICKASIHSGGNLPTLFQHF